MLDILWLNAALEIERNGDTNAENARRMPATSLSGITGWNRYLAGGRTRWLGRFLRAIGRGFRHGPLGNIAANARRAATIAKKREA
jgi:hypothetical protein